MYLLPEGDVEEGAVVVDELEGEELELQRRVRLLARAVALYLASISHRHGVRERGPGGKLMCGIYDHTPLVAWSVDSCAPIL